jgi:hypothetical protein
MFLLHFFPIVRFAGDQKTALIGESLYLFFTWPDLSALRKVVLTAAETITFWSQRPCKFAFSVLKMRRTFFDLRGFEPQIWIFMEGRVTSSNQNKLLKKDRTLQRATETITFWSQRPCKFAFSVLKMRRTFFDLPEQGFEPQIWIFMEGRVTSSN